MLEAVAQVVFEVVCGMIGHDVLWVVTLAGLLFWVLVSVGVAILFMRFGM